MSTTVEAPTIENIATGLPHRARIVGLRELSEISMIVIHCDGRDRLAGDHEMEIIRHHAQYHIDKDWRSAADKKAGRPVEHGDGLMYAYVVTSNAIYRTRDEREVTWHANGANRQGLAIMLLCGFNQAPTEGELANLKELLDHLCHQRPDIPAGQKDVYGHGELTKLGNATPCPGGALLEWVKAYRAGKAADDDPFPVIGLPSISREVFAAQLERRNSPALAEHEGGYYFDLVEGYGLDPGVLLAMFGKESEFGTYEHSPVNKPAMPEAKNWSNIRSHPDVRKAPGGRATRRVNSGPYGFFRGYESWEDGLRDVCEKLLSDDYMGMTLGQVIAKWAPGIDGNDPAGYVNTMVGWIRLWRVGSQGQN